MAVKSDKLFNFHLYCYQSTYKEVFMADFCKFCGSPIVKNAKFCSSCGKALTQSQPIDISPVAKELGVLFASDSPGETEAGIFDHLPTNIFAGEANGGICEKLSTNVFTGTGSVISGSLKRFAGSFKTVIKKPKTLILPLILAALWLLLDILLALDVDIFPVRALSFLTFAQGGLSGGITGFLGGIVGKGIFAGALTFLITSLKRNNSLPKASFSDNIKKIYAVSANSLGGYLAGIGVAVFCYLFISGGLLQAGFMAGIAAAYLSAKAILNRGFLQNLVGSFSAKGKTALGSGALGILKGLAAGFAIAALLGLFQSKLLLIIPAACLLAGGIVIMILQSKGIIQFNRKEGDNV